MQYRSIEEDSLHLYNSYINWIYYLLFISLLLLLYSQSKLNLVKNGFIYIVLLLLPIVIYPYIFKLFQFVFTYFRDESKKCFSKKRIYERLNIYFFDVNILPSTFRTFSIFFSRYSRNSLELI